MHKKLLFFFLVIVLSCSPIGKYQNLPEVQAWEDDIQKFEQLDEREVYPEDAILFAGSSSILLWSSLEIDMSPYTVIQRGFGGAKLTDLVAYSDRIIGPHPCNAIVVFVANDISGTESDKTPREVEKLFRILLKSVRRTHPYTPFFWIAITPTKSRWKVWPEVKQANELIKKYCVNHRNTYFISTDTAFINESGDPRDELFESDMLHLNTDGYAVWTRIIKKELKKVITPN